MVPAGGARRERWPVSSRRGQCAPDAGIESYVDNRSTGSHEDGVVRLRDVVTRSECVDADRCRDAAMGRALDELRRGDGRTDAA
ncbi:hypothetical protein EGT47_18065 [Burkholderia cenocepacia]|nr:hypothetical protein EGT47_18065 [Burkholderia cenocepacia]